MYLTLCYNNTLNTITLFSFYFCTGIWSIENNLFYVDDAVYNLPGSRVLTDADLWHNLANDYFGNN